MNINNYSTNVKNLEFLFAFIGAFVNNENLMDMTLNALRKYYN